MKTAVVKKNKTKIKEKDSTDILNAVLYDEKGKESGKVKLPEGIFDLPWNEDLVHQVAVSYLSNLRNPIAHTKDRSDVRGGGKKPWRQKGTGRARHGSKRSPIWIGGGVTFGPRNDKNFNKKINSKMKTKALFSVLSKKMKDGEILFVDNLSLKKSKTTDALLILKNLSNVKGFEKLLTKKNNSAQIFIPKKDNNISKSFSNFSNISLDEFRNINVMQLLNSKHVLIIDPETSIKFLETKLK